jgi:hypothetical protein
MAASSVKQRKRRVDPDQLDLLDFVPAQMDVAVRASSKAKRPRAKRRERNDAAPAIMSPKDAARYLNLSPETLKVWRAKRAFDRVQAIRSRRFSLHR